MKAHRSRYQMLLTALCIPAQYANLWHTTNIHTCIITRYSVASGVLQYFNDTLLNTLLLKVKALTYSSVISITDRRLCYQWPCSRHITCWGWVNELSSVVQYKMHCFETLAFEKAVTLKARLEVTQGNLKWHIEHWIGHIGLHIHIQ